MDAVYRFVVITSVWAFLSFSLGANAEPPSQQPLSPYVSPYGYDDQGSYIRPTAEEMAYDGLFVRPVSLAGTLAGTVIYLVTLPFSALSGNSQEVAERLIVEPAQYTFTRPFGQVGARFSGHWSEQRH